MEENNANQSKKDEGPKERVREGKRQERLLRSGEQGEGQKEEKVTKRLLVVPIGTAPHLRVKYEGGGELPEELQGVFTSKREADLAIMRYQDKKRNAYGKGSHREAN